MRLLYLTRSLGLHDRRLLSCLKRVGINVASACFGRQAVEPCEPENGFEILDWQGVDAGSPFETLDEASTNLNALTALWRPDIVLAGPVTDCTYVAVNAGLIRPVVAQSWAFDVFWEATQSEAAADRAQIALKRCDGLFADCEAVAERCQILAQGRIRDVHVMPWGIDPVRPANQNWIPSLIADLLNDGKKIVLCTRGLEPIYGVQTLIDAFTAARAKIPDAVLVWAGEGSLRSSLQRTIVERRLVGAVHLVGSMKPPQLASLQAVAHVYVSCALCDGTSVSLLEAMAHGLPVIVGRVGGNEEWVEDGVNGWTCGAGDAADFAGAIIKAMEMRHEQTVRVGVANRDLVAERADLGKNLPRFVAFLREIAERGRQATT